MKGVVVMGSYTRGLLRSGTTCQDHGISVVESCKHVERVIPKEDMCTAGDIEGWLHQSHSGSGNFHHKPQKPDME